MKNKKLKNVFAYMFVCINSVCVICIIMCMCVFEYRRHNCRERRHEALRIKRRLPAPHRGPRGRRALARTAAAAIRGPLERHTSARKISLNMSKIARKMPIPYC